MSNELKHLQKTDIGLEVCYTAPLAYVAGWISGIGLLFLERNNTYVRFHAAQSIAWFGGLSLLLVVLGWVPIINWISTLTIPLVALFSWVFLVYRAWNDSRTGELLRLPIAADIADRILEAMDG